MTSEVLRVAVVSDIHADEIDADTYAICEPPIPLRSEHPLSDLLAYVNSCALRADIVLSAGDMTNKANEAGVSYAWGRIQALAAALHAHAVYGSPGNHDLITRSPTAVRDVYLKLLSPSFPTNDIIANKRFWDEGFVIVEGSGYRMLILNSCAGFPPHPGPLARPSELEAYHLELNRGHFDIDLERRLEDALSGLPYRSINIALIHHHPAEHQALQKMQDSYGPMHRGSEFINLLENVSDTGRWMVVHGHKHVPMLRTVSGMTSGSPIILCAASLAHKLWHPVVTVTRNQFHIIEFHCEPREDLADMRGQIESWEWGYGIGWKPAAELRSGLPARAGFGEVRDHRVMARAISRAIVDSGHSYLSWEETVDRVPPLGYLGPQDIESLLAKLDEINIAVSYDRGHRLVQFAQSTGV